MSSSSTKDLTVIITGGGGGLGKAIANAFLRAGSNVAVCDVNQDRLSQCDQEWKAAYDGRFLTSKTDITNEVAVGDYIRSTIAKFGRLDMVINNAGIMDQFDPIGTTTKASWDRVLSINLTGAFLVTKQAVNTMQAQALPGGTIINIGSVAGYKGVNAGLAYTVSKHGVIGLTKNTAGFYGSKGIYSIAVLLGGMEGTNISDNLGAGTNIEGMRLVQSLSPGYVQGQTNVALADVAKYCIFLADRGIAATSNGGVITFNKNWPAA